MTIENPEKPTIVTPTAEQLAQIPVQESLDTDALLEETRRSSNDKSDKKTGVFLRAFDTLPKRIGWGVTAAASAASIALSAALFSQANSKPTDLPGRTPEASAPLDPTESPAPAEGEVRPGYTYAETPVIELGPVPAGLEQLDSLGSDEYIASATIQERADYGAYLAENIYTYAERFQLISGESYEVLNQITPESPALDLLNHQKYILRLGFSFQSKEDPTKVDIEKALKLYASFFYTSDSRNNDTFNAAKAALLANPTFIDVDTAATGELFTVKYAVTDEGVREPGIDFSANTVPMLQNFKYTNNLSDKEDVSTSFFYQSKDPLTGNTITIPISLGINGTV